MANDQDNDGTKKLPRGNEGLSDEAAEQVKKEILSGAGYRRPPEHTRFKKGRSGNPKGRPKRPDIDPGASRSANALALREGERLINIREGEEIRQIPAIEAVYRAELKSATSGNAYAQKHFIQRYDWGERERRRQIAAEIELWKWYLAHCRAQIAEAEAKGETPPCLLPHPDDVVIDYERGVQLRGPLTEEQVVRVEKNVKLRNLLLMQDALDGRMASKIDSGGPLDRPGSALVFAEVLNLCLPERYKLCDVKMFIQLQRYNAWPKRKLLKEFYRAWHAVGVPARRGRTFPPIRFTKQLLEQLADLLDTTRHND